MSRPSDHYRLRRRRPSGDGITQPKLGFVGYAALLLAPAHQHAHRAVPAAAARDRRGARLARAAAQLRPERRHPVLHRQPRPRAAARQAPGVRRLHLGLVLVDLPAAVHLADRLRHPAHQAPPRRRCAPSRRRRPRGSTGWPASPPARPRRARMPPAAVASARTLLKQGRLPGGAVRQPERVSVSAERGYLRETGNLVFHTALVGPARRRRHRRRLRLQRPAGARRGPDLREHAAGVRLVQPGPVLQRHRARPVQAHPRRLRGELRDRRTSRRSASRSTSPPASR